MEKNPFTFSEHNPRIVTNCETPSKVYFAAGSLFLLSMSLYHKKYFRVDSNVMNLMGFAAVSVPSSYAYANFFLNSAENEAAQKNNSHEGAN